MTARTGLGFELLVKGWACSANHPLLPPKNHKSHHWPEDHSCSRQSGMAAIHDHWHVQLVEDQGEDLGLIQCKATAIPSKCQHWDLPSRCSR